MTDSSYPSIGLRVDLNEIAAGQLALDKMTSSYVALGAAAESAANRATVAAGAQIKTQQAVTSTAERSATVQKAATASAANGYDGLTAAAQRARAQNDANFRSASLYYSAVRESAAAMAVLAEEHIAATQAEVALGAAMAETNNIRRIMIAENAALAASSEAAAAASALATAEMGHAVNAYRASIVATEAAISSTRAMAEEIKAASLEMNVITAAEMAAYRAATKIETAHVAAAVSTGRYVNSVKSLAEQTAIYQGRVVAALMAQHGMTEAEAMALAGFQKLEKAAVSTGNSIKGLGGIVREFVVIMRELARGDFSRLAGSATILGQRMGLLELALTPVGLAMTAFVALTIAGAVAGIQYARSVAALTLSVMGLGSASGLTANQLKGAAESGADFGNESAAAARKQAVAFAAAGVQNETTMAMAISTVRDYALLTGEKVPAATKELAAALANPAKGVDDLNSKLSFMNSTQVESIKRMAEAGDKAGAQAQMMELLRNRTEGASSATTFLGQQMHLLAEGTSNAFGWFGKLIDRLATYATYGPVIGKMMADARLAQQNQSTQTGIQVQQSNTADQLFLNSTPEGRDRVARQALESGLSNAQKGFSADVALGNFSAVGQDIALVNEYTEALKSWIPTAQKAHEEEEIRAKIAATTNRAEKGRLQTQLSLLETTGQVMTAEQRQTIATDAGRVVADKANKSLEDKQLTIRRDIAAVNADADAMLEQARAYEISAAAGLLAEARRKALTTATRDGYNAEQTAARIAAEQRLAVNQQIEGLAQTSTNLETSTANQEAMNAAVANGSRTASEASRQAGIMNATQVLQELLVHATGQAWVDLYLAIQQYTNDTNAAAEATRLFNEESSTRDVKLQFTTIEEETRLIGANTVERARQLAVMKATQVLNQAGVYANPATGKFDNKNDQAAVDNAAALATAQVILEQKTANANNALSYQADLLGAIATQAQTAAASFSAAFGRVGKGLGAMTEAYATYGATQARIDAEQKAALKAAGEDAKAVARIDTLAAAQREQANEQYVTSVLGGVQEMFGKQTFLYKALGEAQKAWSAIQLAAAIESIATDNTVTASMIFNYARKSIAAGVTAVASAMAGLPFPLNLAAGAATVAALAAIGVSIAGHGGHASGPTTAQRQAAEGTGTVLGDAAKQSDSISKALANVARNTNEQLEYSNQMVVALQAISDNIGAVATLVARQLSLSTGAFAVASGRSTQPGNAFLSGGFSLLFPNLFGSTKKTTVKDQGLNLGSQSVGAISSGNLSANYYEDIQTQVAKKFFGVTYSNSRTNSTLKSPVGADLTQQIVLLMGSLKTGVLAAAGALGVTGAQALLDSLVLNLGKISFTGLTGDQIQQQLQAVFSSVADSMAAAVLPVVAQFQKVGEGAFDTLTRIARDYQVVDVTLQSIGMSFARVGISSVAAREHLIDLSGGLDKFTSQAQFFAQNFLTQAQQLAPVQAAVTKELAVLGLSGITTRDQFRDVVLGLDLTTASGQSTYAALMALAPAFAAVTASASDMQDALKSIADYAKGLYTGSLSPLAPQAILAKTQGDYASTLANARGGSLSALQGLPDAAQAYLTNAQQFYGSSQDYARIFQSVEDALNALGDTTTVDPQTAAIQQASTDITGAIADQTAQVVGALGAVSDQVAAMGEVVAGTSADGANTIATAVSGATGLLQNLNGGFTSAPAAHKLTKRERRFLHNHPGWTPG